jgi:hypothetical protein
MKIEMLPQFHYAARDLPADTGDPIADHASQTAPWNFIRLES